MREIRARVDVIRAGAVFCELLFAEPPRIDARADAEIHVSMQGVFLRRDDVNWLSDELRPILTVNGTDWPIATMPIATLRDGYAENGTRTVELTAYDRCLLLKQTRAESRIFFASGTSYLTALQQLLAAAGITLIIAAETDAALATDREWAIGDDYLTIVNTLLSEINFNPVHFDALGRAMLQPVTDPDVERIDHDYKPSAFSILRRPATEEIDAFDAPNIFVVICGNPELGTPLVARAENDNPLSSLSTIRRGRRITSVVTVDNTAGQSELNAYAQRLATESMLRSRTVTISTGVEGGHGFRDSVALTHPDLGGIYVETAWSMDLRAGGEMRHTLQRNILV